MKTQKMISAAVLTAALLGTAALAQSAGQAQITVAPDTPTPTQFVYLAQVPAPADLKSRAAAQGIAVERIDQSQGQTVVVYKYANGATTTVAYAAMPAGDEASVAGTAPPAAPGAPAPSVAVAPASTVVYASAPNYYYPYGYYPYYGGWYSPISIGLGFGWGWGGGFRGGGFRGGWHR
jgi:hypothetical protein